LYDRDMLGEDLSGRFDYLFEPLASMSRPVTATTCSLWRPNSPPTRTDGRDE
jgi:hypothetical protein